MKTPKVSFSRTFFWRVLLFWLVTILSQVIIEVWDTAGQEQYAQIVPLYYRGAQAVVIVYDQSNVESYERARQYVAEVRDQIIPPFVVALIANKSDLEYPVVPTEDVRRFARESNCWFLETSAKTARNVDVLFEGIAEKLVKEAKNCLGIQSSKNAKRIKSKSNNDKNDCC